MAIAHPWSLVHAIDPPQTTTQAKDSSPVLPLSKGELEGVFPTSNPFTISLDSADIRTLEDGLRAGIQQFQSEDYEGAIATWQVTLERSHGADDRLTRALLLSNLSLANQHLGLLEKADQYLTQSLDLFEDRDTANRSLTVWEYYAKALNTKGWLELRQGNTDAALETWKETTFAYRSANHIPGIVGSQINQAKALQSLGLSTQAKEQLETVRSLLDDLDTPSASLKITGLRHLGNALRRVGELDESEVVLMEAKEVVDSIADAGQNVASDLWLDIGNTRRAQWERAVALNLPNTKDYEEDTQTAYKEAIATADSDTQTVLTETHQLAWLIARQNIEKDQSRPTDLTPEIIKAWTTLNPKFQQIPVSRFSLGLQLQAIDSAIAFNQLQSHNGQLKNEDLIAQLEQVATQATALGDWRSHSLALGYEGQIYEHIAEAQPKANVDEESTSSQSPALITAKQLTHQAMTLLEARHASNIQYRWEWQLGRLLVQEGQKGEAIAAYNAAYQTLKTVRANLVGIDADVQFSFRDNVEPVYRELADLLLQGNGDREQQQINLKRATEVIDDLQLVELENFLQCNLSPQLQLSEETVDPTTAIIYPIIFPNRIEVILKLPGLSELKQYTQFVPQKEVQTALKDLRPALEKPYRAKAGKVLGQKIYNWIIQPLKADLAAANIQTLVFSLDGALRSVPMAALYNEETNDNGDVINANYLIEEYALALTPGLNLIKPQPLKQTDLDTLVFGLSKLRSDIRDHDGFGELPYVEYELNQIEENVSAESFLNQNFTSEMFAEQIQALPFPVLHLATHGKFSSEPSETFILAWDKRVDVNELRDILSQRSQRTPNAIELLILSACQTARGDDRAALGLAGVAVQSGARSTIASLWTVADIETADLMSAFYQEISNSKALITKAQALQQAQIQLLQTDISAAPRYWAPYVLVGNWL